MYVQSQPQTHGHRIVLETLGRGVARKTTVGRGTETLDRRRLSRRPSSRYGTGSHGRMMLIPMDARVIVAEATDRGKWT